jgi:hypothetical protein
MGGQGGSEFSRFVYSRILTGSLYNTFSTNLTVSLMED